MTNSTSFEESLIAFLDNASIGIHSVNSEGIVKYVNSAELKMLGYEEGEVLEHNIRDFHLDKEVIEDICGRLAAGEPVTNYEARLRAKDGSVRYVIINSTGFYTEAGFTYSRCFTTDITPSKERSIEAEAELKRREEIERQLKAVERKFKTSLSSGMVGIWTSDLSRGIIYPDEYITSLFELDPSEDGFDIEFLETQIHPEDQARAAEVRKLAIAEGREYACEFRILTKKGKTRWVFARGLTEYSPDGTPIATSGTFLDVTAQKELEKQKDEFLSIASHEFKTPITGLKAYLQLLERSLQAEATSSKISLMVSRSLEQIGKLERLTADLLDVSKIAAGRLVYNISHFNFSEATLAVVESHRLSTKTHQILIQNLVSVDIEGDKHRIEQVLNNLLSNAIKYSPQADRVILNSYLEENAVVVSVQDFGIGIEQDQLSKLFNRFYRVDNTAMKYEGLGLGLFIVSEILKRHGGTFWIESEVGKGSTFLFRIPLAGSRNSEADAGSGNFDSEHVSFQVDQSLRQLNVSWKGFHNMHSVKQGCLKMLAILQQCNCQSVLNDNSNVLGNWAEAVEWVGKEWFPMMASAGLRNFAWVYSSALFGKLSAQKVAELNVSAVNIAFFDSISEAQTWLTGEGQ